MHSTHDHLQCFMLTHCEQAGLQVLEDGSTQLWWAGKEMVDGKKLMDYIGKNEKTTIVAKLQKKGQGPPAREPVFTEVEKKSMMSYAYRKQEELKVCELYDMENECLIRINCGCDLRKNTLSCDAWPDTCSVMHGQIRALLSWTIAEMKQCDWSVSSSL